MSNLERVDVSIEILVYFVESKYKSIYLRICLRINSNSGEKETRKPDYRVNSVSNCHGLVFALAWTCLDLPQPAKEASNRSSRGGWSDDECAARQGSMIPLFFSPPRSVRSRKRSRWPPVEIQVHGFRASSTLRILHQSFPVYISPSSSVCQQLF